jgi:D-alanyl-D-alanine carboxypeptidase/D-alanyl-D-alanine-endopeptidase (penicillin-binding protein 4)
MSELGEWYSAESSALSLNDNCVDIHWTAGATVGAPATYTLDPPTRYVDFVNRVSTVAAGEKPTRSYHRAFESNRIEAGGDIPEGTTAVDYASVHNPTLFAATVLRETLSRRGITVLGPAVDIDDLPRAEVRHDLTELCSSTSPPLSTMVEVTNQNSQNFYADMLLKMVGAEVEGEGSFDAGARAVRHFLDEIGALPTGDAWRMIDGSGLSPQNRTTPRCLVRLLRHMDTQTCAAAFRASLPRGRADHGSLKTRFGYSRRHREVAPQILGKTGYIGGVWTLTGIAANQAGVEFYYSIMLNGYRSESVPPLRLIDDIAVAVAASTFPADARLDPEATLQ